MDGGSSPSRGNSISGVLELGRSLVLGRNWKVASNTVGYGVGERKLGADHAGSAWL